MKLVYFKGKVENFGDELNAFLWDRLLALGFLDEDESELFLGIGSILWDYYPAGSKKVVMGSGYAGYTPPPDVHDGSWDIAFVRGPRTAARLGIPADKAICDSAVLLRALNLPAPASGIGVAFMPHYESLDRGCWAEACRLAGIQMIDPTGQVEKVIAEIRGASLLLCEAMHGAIVADALRTPWVAVRPIHPEHHAKWLDWSEALGLQLRQHPLVPSSLMELYVKASGGKRYYKGKAQRLARSAFARPIDRALTAIAARRLQKLASCEPQLSHDRKIEDATQRAMEALTKFVAAKIVTNV